MALDFFGVRLAGRIRQFVEGDSGGDVAGKVVELWVGNEESELTKDLGALAFVSEINVQYKHGENANITLVLTPPFEDALTFMQSELIRYGNGRLEVEIGYTTGTTSGGGATSGTVLPFSGFLQKPDVSIGSDITITLHALGVGYQMNIVGGTGDTPFPYTFSYADAIESVIRKYVSTDGSSSGLRVTDLYKYVDDKKKTGKSADAFFKRPHVKTFGPLLTKGIPVPGVIWQGPKNDWWFVKDTVSEFGYDLFIQGNEVFIVEKSFWLTSDFAQKGARKHFLLRGNLDPTRNMFPILSFQSPTTAVWLQPGIGRMIAYDVDALKEAGDGKYAAASANETKIARGKPQKGILQMVGDTVLAGIEEGKGRFEKNSAKEYLAAAMLMPGDPSYPWNQSQVSAHWTDLNYQGGIQGQFTTLGIPDLTPGETIQVSGFETMKKGLGDPANAIFNGVYGVIEVNHKVGVGGWETSFLAIMNVFVNDFNKALNSSNAQETVAEDEPIPSDDVSADKTTVNPKSGQ